MNLALDAAESSISEAIEDYYRKTVRCDEKTERYGELIKETRTAIEKAR